METTTFYTVSAAYYKEDIYDGFADYNSPCFNTIEEAKADAKRVMKVYGNTVIYKHEAR